MRFLDPTNDYAFKRIFSYEDILKNFLNAILKKENHNKVKNVTYLNIEQIPDVIAGRGSRLDIKCEDENGDVYIVEMQRQNLDSFEKRLIFYASRAYESQIKIGDGYEKLCPVISIAVLGEVLFKDASDKHSFISYHSIFNESTHQKTFPYMRFICIELPKFKQDSYHNFIEEWVYFFKKAPELYDVPLDSSVQHAYEVLKHIGYDAIERELYETAEKEKADARARLIAAEEKGREEGREEGIKIGEKRGEKRGEQIGEERGIKKEKVDIVRNAKAMNLSIDVIVQLTGLDEEEIKSIM
jgi:predicted transposase/invertase (TIGR01784 family)